MNDKNSLPWTGERFVPYLDGDIVFEHVHRYALACMYSRERDVLDIACGEGYGSYFLAHVAKSVIGVDLNPSAVHHASNKYGNERTRFLVGNCLSIPLEDESVDMVVSFETIEHVSDHEIVMKEFKRVLRKDGILIVSCPEKRNYSDVPGYSNPFHEKELYLNEFVDLVGRHFRNNHVFHQKMTHGSLIVPSENITGYISFANAYGNSLQLNVEPRLVNPVYNISLCSDCPLPAPIASIFEGVGIRTSLEIRSS